MAQAPMERRDAFTSLPRAKSETAKAKWSSFVENSTLHGLYYVVHSPTTFRKTLWALFVIIGISWFTYQSSKLLTKYYSYPVSTKVSLEHDHKPKFPAVTICNFNLVRASAVASVGFENVFKLAARGRMANPQFSNDTIDWSKFNLTGINMTKFYIDGGHKIQNMLLLCQWSGERCTAANFTEILTSMGLCHTFNSGEFHDMSFKPFYIFG